MSLQSLVDNKDQFLKFKEASPAAQRQVIQRLQAGISEGATDIILKKLISTPVQISESGDTDVPLAWKDVPVEAIKNIPSDSWSIVKDMWQAVSHPLQTAKGVRDIATGTLDKAERALKEGRFGMIDLSRQGESVSPLQRTPKEEYVDNIVQVLIKDRFGSLEKLKRTIASEPVQLATDIGSLLSGGGGALAKIPGVSKVGKTVSKVGSTIDPIAQTGKAASALAKKGVPHLSKSLVQSSVKFPDKTRTDEVQRVKRADELSAAFVQGDFKITEKSVNTTSVALEKIGKEIGKTIEDATNAGIRVKVDDILAPLDKLIEEWKTSPLIEKTSSQAAKVKRAEKFRSQLVDSSSIKKGTLSPSEVQRLKRIGNEKYKANVSSVKDSIIANLDDAIRQGGREALLAALDEQFPQLRTLNKDFGVKKEILNAMAKRLKTFTAEPTVGARGLIAGGIGAGAAMGFGGDTLKFAIATFLASKLLSNPNFQIKVARILNKSNTTLAKAGKFSQGAKGLFQAGRATGDVSAEQAKQRALEAQRLRSVN